MADRGCDDRCGCVVPCPGDDACRCSAGRREVKHSLCGCGEHCRCNPCSCGRTAASPAVGKAACICLPNCGCAACAAASSGK